MADWSADEHPFGDALFVSIFVVETKGVVYLVDLEDF